MKGGDEKQNRTKQKVLFKEDGEKTIPKTGCIYQYRCLYTTDECTIKKPDMKGGDEKQNSRRYLI